MKVNLFNLRLPIIQAPMDKGITTPELVAAVSNAGGLGSLAAGYMLPSEIRKHIQKIKTLTKKPFNVNLFIPQDVCCLANDLISLRKILNPLWSQLSKTPFKETLFSMPSFEEQIEVLLEENIPVFSFTFGLLSGFLMDRFKRRGVQVYGTATTPEEALLLENNGVDAILCQGKEAGGLRGSFLSSTLCYSLSSLISLTKNRVKVPLIAAGGIMNGHVAQAFLFQGASAVQLGTAFLTTIESGAHPTYKKALLKKSGIPTLMTKCFTGKEGRCVANLFTREMDECQTLPYPFHHFLTQPIRFLAALKNQPDFMSLWAGEGYSFCQVISAAELVFQIEKQMQIK